MKKLKILFFLFLAANFFYFPAAGRAAINLVKVKDSPTVYYLDGKNYRRPFPTESIYKSWYGNDYSRVITVSEEFLAGYAPEKNITARPGKNLVKFYLSPKVYAVEQGGKLRHLDNEYVAEEIFGKNWQKKVIDIPDVFFGDYVFGKDIDREYDIPDNVLYKVENESIYYYKNNGILRPFASLEAIYENGLEIADAISVKSRLYSRSRPITGYDKNVFNIEGQPIWDLRDCENKKLKAAFVFVSDNKIAEEIDKVQKIKSILPERFAWATDSLSEIDTSWPTTVLKTDEYLVVSINAVKKLTNEVSLSFFDSNPDIFDFMVIFTNFDTEEDGKIIATFTPITNLVAGIGKNFLDASEIYGSYGKLKGIISMGNINKYDLSGDKGMNQALNYLLHEILHQWSGSLLFVDENGELSAKLLKDDKAHWSYYAGWMSPLGGSGWQANNDGTFTSLISQISDSGLKKYAYLDLYAMGLYPYQAIGELMYVAPETANDFGNTIKGQAKYVKMEQIISANGRWACGLQK